MDVDPAPSHSTIARKVTRTESLQAGVRISVVALAEESWWMIRSRARSAHRRKAKRLRKQRCSNNQPESFNRNETSLKTLLPENIEAPTCVRASTPIARFG